ncbi:MAG: tail fiber protein [Planctomycetota bacterium]
MATPYLGEIKAISFNYAPKGWALCNGQLLAINTNAALFSILGTTYGGNGTTNFALPNLQGKVPISFGSGPGLSPRTLGETGGEEAHTLNGQEMAAHTHPLNCSSSSGGSPSPTNNVWAKESAGVTMPYSNQAGSAMSGQALAGAGGNLPHENRQPYLVVNYVIALTGIYPSRS